MADYKNIPRRQRRIAVVLFVRVNKRHFAKKLLRKGLSFLPELLKPRNLGESGNSASSDVCLAGEK